MVRRLFVAVIAFYALQAFVVAYAVEPYPALIQPPFPGAAIENDSIVSTGRVEIAVRFRAGATDTISPGSLFDPAPSSHYSAMLRQFRPPPDEGGADVAAGGGWMRTVASSIPGLAARMRLGSAAETDPRTRAWLRRRLGDLYPDRTVARIEFVWWQERFAVESGALLGRELRGVRRIEVDE